MLTGNPASDEVQVPGQLPLQAARRLTVVRTLAGAGPGAVADKLDGPHEHLPRPHQVLPAEPELAGALGSAHRDPETDQGISAVCGYPEGVGLMALDVLSCQLDSHAEGSHDTARIHEPDDNGLCRPGRVVVLPGQGTQLPGEQFKVVLRHVTEGRARSHPQLGCNRRYPAGQQVLGFTSYQRHPLPPGSLPQERSQLPEPLAVTNVACHAPILPPYSPRSTPNRGPQALDADGAVRTS